MKSSPLLFILSLFLLATGCSHPRSQERIQLNEEERLAAALAKRPKIVIDAGHGGQDQGAVAVITPPQQEKNLNLQTALMLNAFLQKMGYQTILTRGNDVFVPLELRASIANSNQAAVFVSVHYNSAPSPKAEGVEVYYFDSKENKARTEESRALASKVLERVVESTGSKSRGIKHGSFAVIRETTMPAILVEGGFLTHQKEVEQIISPLYMKTIAAGIALGINDFLKWKQTPLRQGIVQK